MKITFKDAKSVLKEVNSLLEKHPGLRHFRAKSVRMVKQPIEDVENGVAAYRGEERVLEIAESNAGHDAMWLRSFLMQAVGTHIFSLFNEEAKKQWIRESGDRNGGYREFASHFLAFLEDQDFVNDEDHCKYITFAYIASKPILGVTP